jgi:hypothetical protein
MCIYIYIYIYIYVWVFVVTQNGHWISTRSFRNDLLSCFLQTNSACWKCYIPGKIRKCFRKENRKVFYKLQNTASQTVSGRSRKAFRKLTGRFCLIVHIYLLVVGSPIKVRISPAHVKSGRKPEDIRKLLVHWPKSPIWEPGPIWWLLTHLGRHVPLDEANLSFLCFSYYLLGRPFHVIQKGQWLCVTFFCFFGVFPKGKNKNTYNSENTESRKVSRRSRKGFRKLNRKGNFPNQAM